MADTLLNIDAQAALDQVAADWNRAGATWDADAFAAVYTEDGMLYGGRPGHSVGRDGIRAYFASYEGVIKACAWRFSNTEFRTLAQDCVLMQGMVDFTFELAGGEQTRSTLRATLVLKEVGGRWLILEHHFSAIPEAPPLGND